MVDYDEIGRHVGRYGSVRLTRSELFPLLNAMHENAALRRELQKDAPLALKARQWRRAEEAAGEGRTMDELRTLDRIAADYRRELWELAAPDTEAGEKDG